MRTEIREQYAKAATEAVALCSTDAYKGMDLRWVPDEVLNVNQGCGSPLGEAKQEIKRGHVVVDLGCGAGLDAFLAAKQVGAGGRVIGIDMTPEMLAIARRNSAAVARNLGYEQPNVVFHEAAMEDLPLDSASADCVISNCVINLSDDKQRVFDEIFRVLKPGGRFVISDILAMAELPQYIRNNELLVGRCLGGALSLESFLSVVRRSGFRGVTLISKKSYAQVDMHDFVSLTVSAYKVDAAEENGIKYATLLGPCSSGVDEAGNHYRRGVPTEISAETAALLRLPRYREYFFLSAQPREIKGEASLAVLPEPGPCIYGGDFVALVGPFTQVADDDAHVFAAGKESEVCGKTMKVLTTPLYKKLFVMVNRCQGEIEARQVLCGPSCC
jgi:arsenite methyltransferase